MSLDLYILRQRERKKVALDYETAGLDRHESFGYGEERADDEVWTANMTHNLGKMASRVGIGGETLYSLLWYPPEFVTPEYKEKIREAREIVRGNKEELEKFNPPNGWGRYENLRDFLDSFYERLCLLGEDEEYKLYASI